MATNLGHEPDYDIEYDVPEDYYDGRHDRRYHNSGVSDEYPRHRYHVSGVSDENPRHRSRDYHNDNRNEDYKQRERSNGRKVNSSYGKQSVNHNNDKYDRGKPRYKDDFDRYESRYEQNSSRYNYDKPDYESDERYQSSNTRLDSNYRRNQTRHQYKANRQSHLNPEGVIDIPDYDIEDDDFNNYKETAPQRNQGKARTKPEEMVDIPDYDIDDEVEDFTAKKRREAKPARSSSFHRDRDEYNSTRRQFAPDYQSNTSRKLSDPPSSKSTKAEEIELQPMGTVPGKSVDFQASSNVSTEKTSVDDDDSYYENDHGAFGTVKTVDMARSIRMRRHLLRGRAPVLSLSTAYEPGKAKSSGNAEQPSCTAEEFVKLSREQKAREQIQDQHSQELYGIDKVKFKGVKGFKTTQSAIGEFTDYFEIWLGAFKSIEGHFGSSIVAYFRFVKWLFLMNLLTFFLILCVIILPQELLEPDTFSATMEGIPESDGYYSTEQVDYHLEALNCSHEYMNNLTMLTDDGTAAEKILDFFLGTGWMEDTILFVGYYFNKTLYYEEVDDSSEDPVYGELTYNMPLAFLLSTVGYFLVILILMVNYTGKGVKDRLVNSGDHFNRCCQMVLCGWDYNLRDEKAAKLKHKNLFNEFFNDVAERERRRTQDAMKLTQRICLFITRLLIWLFVFAVWGCSFYLIIMVVGTWVPQLLEEPDVIDSWILLLVVEFLPSFTITGINVIAAPMFQIIVKFEDYAPETEVRVTIARTVILRLASIGVLSFSLNSRITGCKDETRDETCGYCEDIQCWETYVGQEYYKLVIVDFFVIIGVTLFVEFPRRLMVNRFPNNFVLSKVGLQEFELPKNVLEIVYSQTISWIGGFFSPLIPAITAVKFFIFFYIKKLTLKKNCIPAKRPYRASKSNYFFMIILMVSYAMSLIVISYAMGRIPPSKGCGPWRVYTRSNFYMYTTISDTIALLPKGVEEFFNILTNWVLYIVLLIILFLIIYYYQAIASGNKRKVELLKEQLAAEGMDKQFLLRQVNIVLSQAAAQPVE